MRQINKQFKCKPSYLQGHLHAGTLQGKKIAVIPSEKKLFTKILKNNPNKSNAKFSLKLYLLDQIFVLIFLEWAPNCPHFSSVA